MRSTRKSSFSAAQLCCRPIHENEYFNQAVRAGDRSVAVVSRSELFASSGRTAVDLSLISGKINVVGWDRPDVHIRASIESGYLDLSANSSRITLGVDDEGRGRRHGHGNVGEAQYDVQVPRGARLILEAVSGDVNARGSQGEIEATSVSGDVDVADGNRDVSVESVSGSAHAANINGNLRAETVSGDLRAETVSGNVEANSVSGTIRLSNIQSRDVRTETVSGDIIYIGSIEPTGRYGFESHSGSLRLTIPRNAGASFSVDTFSGDISTDFQVTVPPTPQGRHRDERHMEFTIGDGRARVTASTFSGRIVVNNADSTRREQE